MTFDLVDRVVLVGGEPEPAYRHGVARPGFEFPAVAGAVEHEKSGRWESDTAAPREREAAVGLLDEVVEITFPAMVEVAEEHQPTAVVHERPMREVYGAHAAQVAVRGHDAQDEAEAQ